MAEKDEVEKKGGQDQGETKRIRESPERKNAPDPPKEPDPPAYDKKKKDGGVS